MKYNSDNDYFIRLACRGTYTISDGYEYMKAERTTEPNCHTRMFNAVDFKLRKEITIHLYAIHWRSGERLFLFTLPPKAISICLDQIYIVMY